MTLMRYVRWGGIVLGAAIVIAAAHCLFRRASPPPAPVPAEAPPVPTAETDRTAPVMPRREFTRKDQEKVRTINTRILEIQRKLQAVDNKVGMVKINANRTNTEVIRLHEAAARTSAALQSEINKFPGLEKARGEFGVLEARRRELAAALAQAEQHLEHHGKTSEARPTAVPDVGCLYCAKDFDRFVARDAEVVGQVESRIQEMAGELTVVSDAGKAMAVDFGRLQKEALAQPLVQRLLQQQAEEKQAVDAALSADPNVKAILAERAGLVRERDERIRSRRDVYHATKVVQVEAVPRGPPIGEGRPKP